MSEVLYEAQSSLDRLNVGIGLWTTTRGCGEAAIADWRSAPTLELPCGCVRLPALAYYHAGRYWIWSSLQSRMRLGG